MASQFKTEPYIVLTGLKREFPDGTGLHDAELAINQGEFISIVGPSGCGKTTLLRCVAGLETPDSGHISVNGRVIFDSNKKVNVAVKDRDLSMVFQDLALWPHMNVRQIVEFPLTCSSEKLSAQVRRQKVENALRLVGIEDKAGAKPQELSGGQQQRVAIARALVTEPTVMLLDEPLSALDPNLSAVIKDELLRLNKELKLTMLYVTHDQHEALAMSDRIIVMNGGNVIQYATPFEVYEQPANDFVASFVGHSNPSPDGNIRPEKLAITEDPIAPYSGTVLRSQYIGGRYEIRCKVDHSPHPWLIYASNHYQEGATVRITTTAENSTQKIRKEISSYRE